MTQGTPALEGRQARRSWSVADVFSALRIPLAVAFPLADSAGARLAILGLAAGSDLADGYLARRFGGSSLGAVLDPVADKLFMVSAFAVVAVSRRLELLEVAGVLLRDIVATGAFIATALRRAPSAIPARFSGKAVTVAQLLTLLAFVLDSPLLRPFAWATAALGVYAVWDYARAAPRERLRLR
ncbi:MAG TPA: CDP-alcohol phosphatidyltransferase family protein [Gemmatimonadales bacterium]|nr:CDP-alcohol phosphatidyltransferase family protein [Gemmatimonadales bacterium]